MVREYVDKESAWRDKVRPEFERMLEDAARRDFKAVVVWAYDRLQRKGVGPTFSLLDRLAGMGVMVYSYTEPVDSLPPGPMRDIFISVKAAVAQMESEAISRRTKAGIERHRAAGGRHGRPKGSRDILPRIGPKRIKKLGITPEEDREMTLYLRNIHAGKGRHRTPPTVSTPTSG